MGEVFDAEDSITIIKKHRESGWGAGRGAGWGAGRGAGEPVNIKNQLNSDIRLIVLNTDNREPVFLPVGSKKAVNFDFLNISKKMEIYT